MWISKGEESRNSWRHFICGLSVNIHYPFITKKKKKLIYVDDTPSCTTPQDCHLHVLHTIHLCSPYLRNKWGNYQTSDHCRRLCNTKINLSYWHYLGRWALLWIVIAHLFSSRVSSGHVLKNPSTRLDSDISGGNWISCCMGQQKFNSVLKINGFWHREHYITTLHNIPLAIAWRLTWPI